MNTNDFINRLKEHPEMCMALRLPDGARIPAHFHITEVGHVTRRFIDCGGTRRHQETCLLQTWVHDDVEHRLTAGKLAGVFERLGDLLEDFSLPIEFEVELGTASWFGVEDASVVDGSLEFALSPKPTDCLARGVCLPDGCGTVGAALGVSEQPERCAPGGGCC
jgi:hypothetical protein